MNGAGPLGGWGVGSRLMLVAASVSVCVMSSRLDEFGESVDIVVTSSAKCHGISRTISLRRMSEFSDLG